MAGRKKRKESGTDETEADLNGQLKEAVDGEDPSSKSRVQRRRLDPAQVEVLEAHFQKDIYPSASSKVNSRFDPEFGWINAPIVYIYIAIIMPPILDDSRWHVH